MAILERNMDEQLQCVFVASGQIHADQVQAFLGAAGIATIVRGESLRQTHGLTLDGLGAVEILVADADAERARSLIDEAEAGHLRLANDVDVRDQDTGVGSNTAIDDGEP